jgi:hypothetical protein
LQICATTGDSPKPPDEIERLLKLFLEWILFSENQVYIQVSLSAIKKLTDCIFQSGAG